MLYNAVVLCDATMADLDIPEARPLNDPPTDGVTKLSYLQDTSRLASTSWDGTVRVHDTAENKCLVAHSMDSGPLFSFSYQDSLLFTGGMDGSIRKFDVNSSKQQATLVGKHKNSSNDSSDKASCSCLAVVAPGMIASAGWHQQFHIWDLRQQSPVVSVDLPGKAFSMDHHRHHGDGGVFESTWIAIATSGRRTCFIDVRSMTSTENPTTAKLIVNRESTLKYQTRCVRFLPDGTGIAVGCIEGRVAIENLEELGQKDIKNFAFKCHRDGDLVYPVNAIDFHPGYGTFATGGADGTVGTV